jgi:hypothetical protein
MTSLGFDALSPEVDAVQASDHLRYLHEGAKGVISMVLLGTAKGRERHSFFQWDEAKESEEIRNGKEALQNVVDAHWNVYIACSTFKNVPSRGRGGRDLVLEVPGVWADLDVKPGTEGYFQSEDELLEYTRHLPAPTLEVASGSGGRHLYWLTKQRMNATDGQNLLHAWLDFLREWSDGKTIEHVQDSTRILRLAGTIRWPKEVDSTTVPRRVELLNVGPRYHDGELQLMSARAHAEAQEHRRSLRAFLSQQDAERRSDLLDRGLQEATYSSIVARFNIVQDWASLLEPTGWTLISDDREMHNRCRYWARPGKSASDGKSASTDYTSEAGITSSTMTIFSSDPSVMDLWENPDTMDNKGRCSKWRYALMRLYQGDEARLVKDVIEGRGQLR